MIIKKLILHGLAFFCIIGKISNGALQYGKCLPELSWVISCIVFKKSGEGTDIIKAHLLHDLGYRQIGIFQQRFCTLNAEPAPVG